MKLEQIPHIVAELSAQIAGCRVGKIHQPAADLLLFRLWNGRENLKLLISVSAQENCIGLTEQSFPNPFTPPRFCQLLRARLSRIVKVAQLNDDRIIELTCQGPKGDCRLIVELFGKGGNLVLINGDGMIIDSLKRQPGGRLAPKMVYTFPEKKLTNDGLEVTNGAENGAGIASAQPFIGSKVFERTADLAVRLRKLLQKELKKLAKRDKNISQERGRQQNFERFRIQGELLLANIHLLKRGMSEVVVIDYYQQPAVEVRVTLNPLLTPQENAAKYFQKYKKARRGLEHSARRLEETAQEIDWLEQLVYQLDSAANPGDISDVAEELKKAGLLKEKISKLPRLQKGGVTFKESFSPSGFKILWGTNSRQNDALSTKILKRGDRWFHAQRCPGSHVVLKADRAIGEFAEADLSYAASIAAANSKAGKDLKVEVMIAEAKEVKKPAGAKPGMVTVARYKTLVVQPITEKIDDI